MERISEDELIRIRRELHQIPEIGLEEEKTSSYLLENIRALPQDRLIIKVQDTAIIVIVKGKNSSKTIAWRTDMDALPILENTDLAFQSTHEGVMHACGHDFHMTIALGLLKNVVNVQLNNDVVFFFQPAEENKSGAKIYTDNHFLDVAMIDEIYGLHVSPTLPVGSVSTCVGTLFAGDCGFSARFYGKESHAALPHEGNDMIVAVSSFVQQIQTIVSRNVNPMESAVITFGQLNAGVASNVLPGSAKLTGTIRTLTHGMTDLVVQRVKDIVKGIEVAYQCKIEIDFNQLGYVPVVNDKDTTTKLMDFFNEQQDMMVEIATPLMTAEDFGYLLKQIPGTMFWLGVDSQYGLHHPSFNPNESALIKGVTLMTDYFIAQDN